MKTAARQWAIEYCDCFVCPILFIAVYAVFDLFPQLSLVRYATELASINISNDQYLPCLMTNIYHWFLPLITCNWATIALEIVGCLQSVVELLPQDLLIYEYFILLAALAGLVMPSQLADFISTVLISIAPRLLCCLISKLSFPLVWPKLPC